MALAVLATCMSVMAFAQDTTRVVTNTTSSSTSTVGDTATSDKVWYMQPWAWFLLAGLLLLLLIGLLKGKKSTSNTERVTVTKTVDRENNP